VDVFANYISANRLDVAVNLDKLSDCRRKTDMFVVLFATITLCLKNAPPLTCHNLYIHGSTATSFGKNVAEKVGTFSHLT